MQGHDASFVSLSNRLTPSQRTLWRKPDGHQDGKPGRKNPSDPDQHSRGLINRGLIKIYESTMRAFICRTFVFLIVFPVWAMAQVTGMPANPNAFPLYLNVELDKSVKLSRLNSGDVTVGRLTRDVFSPDGKILSAGSRVSLTVDHLDRKRKLANDRWPWVAKLFLPRHEMFPSFKEMKISGSDGTESRLDVSLISAGRRTEMHPQAPKQNRNAPPAAADVVLEPPSSAHPSKDLSPAMSGLILSLQGQANESLRAQHGPMVLASSIEHPATLPAGTTCRILLLDELQASKSHSGDRVTARLLEPVLLDGRVVLPAGSMFEGSILKAKPPRMLSRPGSLFWTFSRVTLPDDTRFSISSSLAAMKLDHGSHIKVDSEGALHGDRPGMTWMLINGGVTSVLAKEVDDDTQFLMEAILSGATDASTAGTARIAGSVVSTVFMLTRHGRDVIVPSFTEMNVTLNRPLTVSAEMASTAPANQRQREK